MIYTIIAEGRSGGQTLIEWFKLSLKDFIVSHEPFNKDNKNFTENTDKTDFNWLDKNKNYIIKELYSDDILPLLSISDNVICLYRENWKEQIKSLLYAVKTNRWHIKYTEENIKKFITDDEIVDFYNCTYKKIKENFQNFIVTNNLKSISYEDLYYNNGIDKIKKHFNITSNIEFPIGQRYFTKENPLI
jgi:uncharacterized protein YdhG (YjbR/CyaY superfamily)